MKSAYRGFAFIFLVISFHCSAIERDRITSMLIEYPLSNVVTSEKKGFKGNVAEVSESGYRLLVNNDGIEFLHVLPSTYYKFSNKGYLEKLTYDYSLSSESIWHYENDRLIQLKSVSESNDGRNNRTVLIDLKYDEKSALTKIISISKAKGFVENQDGCDDIIMKGNTIYNRYCHGGQEQIYTFNDDHKVVMIEKVKPKDNATSVLFNKNIKTKYFYENGRLSRYVVLHDDVKKNEVFTEYGESGNVALERIKQFSNDRVIVEKITKFDEYGNETSHKVLQDKPLNHNPIYGKFEARSGTKTDHVQKNDKYGNAISLMSTFYKIESDQSETVLKKEFKYYTYKYYEDKKDRI